MGSVINGYIATFSGSFDVAVLVWPLLSLLLSVPVLVVLYRRDGWLPLTTVFAVYASILYAAGLVCFTLYPLPTGDSGPGITYGIPPQWVPLNSVADIAHGGLKAALQVLFNIALFVPLGFIARTLLKLKFPLALALSFTATCLVETAQLTGLFGVYPFAYRTFDVDDILWNTLGGVIGWGLGHLAVKLTQREAEVLPPVTHRPGFVRRAVALWTDAMIIDVCSVVPRLMVVIGLKVLMGDAFDEAMLNQVNAVVWVTCYIIAFAIVEVVVPWIRDGSTPAGLFYRMSCETQQRTGAARVAFYALRAAALLLVLVYPQYAVLPLAVFYLVARKMPYDFVPGEAAEGASREAVQPVRGMADTPATQGAEGAEGPEGADDRELCLF